ncbi:ATP-grasp domain-containing protein [candidate division FCPU426 bacterium]|nr:ATP-grasp domain-containing protein [candidate division FCPU426 bacterium]
MKQKLKVLIIFDVPERPTSTDWSRHFRPEDWKNELDIIQAVKKIGHEVRLLGVHDRIRPLITEIRRHPPDIVFNLLEAYVNDRRHESNIAGLLDLLNVKHTGSDAATLSICRNKLFAKRILAPHRIKTPRSVVFPLGKTNRSLKNLKFPVFVKPLGQGGSDGIAQKSFAEDTPACLERVRFLHDHLKTDALVEEYIEGREVYASVIGNQRLRVLPLREMIFTQFPEEKPKFATFKSKWDDSFRRKWGIQNIFAAPLPNGMEKKIAHISRTAFRALNLRGYGRLDLRITPENEIYVIEVNPNPALTREDEIAQSALKAKISYPRLLQRILWLGYQSQ